MSSPSDQLAALRILDANFNRASEGLRVVEEYLRFGLDDRRLSLLCKQLRHDLATAAARWPVSGRITARDTLCDVGTTVSTPQEGRRASLADLALANCQRVQQALRALEEYGKLIDPDAAPLFEALRYRLYTLAKACQITTDSLARLAGVRLYVLIDGAASEAEFERRTKTLIDAGVDALQLRDKRLADRELLSRARRLREWTRGTRTLFLVNDRPDLARLSEADGVHVGQEELSVADARRIVGPEPLVGVSTHNLEQARRAVLEGANYLGCGPTFPSSTKEFAAFAGLDFLRQVAAEIRLPAFAIGGIGTHNLPDVLATGFRRIAVSGAVAASADPASAVQDLRRLLEAAEPPQAP